MIMCTCSRWTYYDHSDLDTDFTYIMANGHACIYSAGIDTEDMHQYELVHVFLSECGNVLFLCIQMLGLLRQILPG